MNGRTSTWLASLANFAMIANAMLLGALVVLAFDPQRRAFGRATGLWHDCIPRVAGGMSYARWSPVLLVLLIPAVVGVIVSASLPRPTSIWLTGLSVLLGVAAIGLVVMPMGSCIA